MNDEPVRIATDGVPEQTMYKREMMNEKDSVLNHLRFLEDLDKVNRVIQSAGSLEQMMKDVLGAVLSIFGCDRAWLFYPCDPNAPTFQVPMEVTRPEYPGAGVLNQDIPLPPDMAQNLREALESVDPVVYIVGTERPVNKVSAEQFGVQSLIMMALYPKSGKPWAFGMHQCSYARVWTIEEKRLFQEIGRRLADGLTSLLIDRDLRASEKAYRRIVEATSEGIWMIDKERKTTFVNQQVLDFLGYREEELIGKRPDDFVVPEERTDHEREMEERRTGKRSQFERCLLRKDGNPTCFSISAAPIFDEQNQFVGSLAMLTDITKRKEMEAKRAKYLKELEDMNKLMISRELKMIELKKENERLKNSGKSN